MRSDLHIITAEPRGEDVVELLEEALAQAKAGEFSSIAFAGVYRNGCTQQAWSSAPSVSLLLGSVSRLEYRLNQFIDQ
jgi:glycogen debranching enzyme